MTPDTYAAYTLGTADEGAALNLDELRARVQALAPPEQGVFDGQPNALRPEAPAVKIHYRVYENPQETQGGIVIFSGRTEGAELYLETIADLLRNGWSVYIHDHRGQGFSSRLLADPEQASAGFVDEFGRYVDDAQTVVNRVAARRQGNPRPLFLLAHSMGGAIASLLLERGAGPFKAAVLVTPMHQPWVAGTDAISWLWPFESLCAGSRLTVESEVPLVSTAYISGVDFDREDKSFRPDSITSSPSRLALNWLARAAHCQGEACGHPDAKVGGLTMRWLVQACAGALEARGPAAQRISVPMLVLQGTQDKVVEPGAQREFCQNVNQGKARPLCTLRTVADGRHALLIERDEIRRPVLGQTMGFFQCVARGGTGCP
ncbi:alpha/beta fold hydrolase [Ideonella sp. 4Y16]|uniref:alpha/beta fold hydrolase n=1 Tax=Ideonella alba TaxID=2824118 RepID=UPI001B36AFA1|nr:alpha/beta fold hydrolase [Ideonella alba]MBQ0942272.1 alpha/beta fold hydrolase [Ideonella alba]